ncbi:MAG: GntR family transcriptional regulator [Coriobacteriia bacterium]|nr:GntR family transcriptional regulator [Coriobacteriia bacterium]
MIRFSAEKPIYAQIVDLMQVRIMTGVYQPQTQLPSVRDLAIQLGVNPNTVQRALARLEQSGFVKSERTAGRFVSDDTALIQQARTTLVRDKAKDFLCTMRHYGCSDAEIREIIEGCMREAGEDR